MLSLFLLDTNNRKSIGYHDSHWINIASNMHNIKGLSLLWRVQGSLALMCHISDILLEYSQTTILTSTQIVWVLSVKRIIGVSEEWNHRVEWIEKKNEKKKCAE